MQPTSLLPYPRCVVTEVGLFAAKARLSDLPPPGHGLPAERVFQCMPSGARTFFCGLPKSQEAAAQSKASTEVQRNTSM